MVQDAACCKEVAGITFNNYCIFQFVACTVENALLATILVFTASSL